MWPGVLSLYVVHFADFSLHDDKRQHGRGSDAGGVQSRATERCLLGFPQSVQTVHETPGRWST